MHSNVRLLSHLNSLKTGSETHQVVKSIDRPKRDESLYVDRPSDSHYNLYAPKSTKFPRRASCPLVSQRLLTGKRPMSTWNAIIDEYEMHRQEVDNYKKEAAEEIYEPEEQKCHPPEMVDDLQLNLMFQQILGSIRNYMDIHVFPVLGFALQETLFEVIKHNHIQHPKGKFNALDCIAEILWNLNPSQSDTRNSYIHDMTWVIDYLKENPRPYFPFSAIWSENYAATIIQKCVRGYWIRRRPDVQEMRQFWKSIKENSSHAPRRRTESFEYLA